MGKILLVNTGPTEYEHCSDGPTQGQIGQYAPASDLADAVAGRLEEYQPVVAIYSMPLTVALEMADLIANKLSVEPDIMPGFEDEDPAQWKGLSREELAVMDCHLSERDTENAMISFPFACGPEELRARLAQTLDKLASLHKKETIAIVSHRALTVLMVLHLLHMSNRHFNQVAQQNGALNLFEVRGGVPSALYINDTCHLEGLVAGQV